MDVYDAYLFDWDGTLACTADIWLEATKRELAVEGITISDAENARHLGSFEWFSETGLPRYIVEELSSRVVAAAQRRLSEVALYDSAAELLTTLHRAGRKLALVTSTGPDSLEMSMGRHNIGELFDTIVTGQDVSHTKPDPEGILLALDRLHVEPTRAIMLGDTRNDILAAHNAGIDSALFYPETHQLIHDLGYLQSHNPTHIIRHWQELINLPG